MQEQNAHLRLALRHEGEFWNAYVAPIGTMEGAFLLGSIRMAAVGEDRMMKDAFMSLMQISMAAAIESVIGMKVKKWSEPAAAPEHERAGRA